MYRFASSATGSYFIVYTVDSQGDLTQIDKTKKENENSFIAGGVVVALLLFNWTLSRWISQFAALTSALALICNVVLSAAYTTVNVNTDIIIIDKTI